MLKQRIKYEDYNGVEREEDFYFNLSKSELLEMEMGEYGGLSGVLEKVIQTTDQPKIIKIFKDLVLKAYGQKSDDGKRFIKSEELSIAFSQTEAYSNLFMELAFDSKKAADFVNGLMPKDLINKIGTNNQA